MKGNATSGPGLTATISKAVPVLRRTILEIVTTRHFRIILAVAIVRIHARRLPVAPWH